MQTECLLLGVEQLKVKKYFDLAYSLIKDDARKEKISGYNFLDDKCLSLGAGLLIEWLKRRTGVSCYPVLEEKNQKPYFKGNPVYFNLSHGKSLVAMAFSSAPIGVDLEFIKRADQRVVDRYYSAAEKIRASEGDEGFFDVWTKKESYLKMKGLTVFNLKEIDVYSKTLLEEVDFFQTKKESYLVTACVEKGSKVNWQTLTLTEILKVLT